MLRIESLEVADHILEKIEGKHGVSFTEVEEACLSERRQIRRGREGLSQTATGRYLLVVLINLSGGNWRVATAREMTSSERRLYIKAMGGR